MNSSSQICAGELLEVVPLIMRAMRAEVRSHRAPELSLPQFRALAFIGRNEGAMLADVANFLGLTPPSASRLVDGLVSVKYVTRKMDTEDRRKNSLSLSGTGRARYEVILRQARTFLSDRVSGLTEQQLQEIISAMKRLREIFEPDQPSEVGAN